MVTHWWWEEDVEIFGFRAEEERFELDPDRSIDGWMARKAHE
jgi:hypothetical protein